MMKKFIALFISVIICLCFVSCSNSDIENTSVATTETEAELSLSSEIVTSENNSTEVVTETSTEVLTEITSEMTSSIDVTTSNSLTVNLTIDCSNILKNIDKLNSAKKSFVPDDGIILDKTVEINSGEIVFDVLQKACADNPCKSNCQYCTNGIQMEYTFTPAYNSNYIEGIHQLYEFDCGASSGWMYSVDGVFPDKGCSAYELKGGENIVFAYTCDLGADLGNSQN